ncbi:winged helix-turn-helix transcriptional regulator [Candidatus Woesearchaeota archaeon]|nr:winged helix-turn-helix transcriptional regulator [Candidatus Woesearchaeota archaeon]
MQSISNYEFQVLNFLVRNFSTRYTVRQISLKLKASPAGIHKGLKKLEEDDILKSEKLGTGLFYYINLDNQIAKHLAAIVLLMDGPEATVVKKLEGIKEARAVIVNKNNLLVVTHSPLRTPSEFSTTTLSEHELAERLKQRDKKILEFLEHGKLIFGENTIIAAIKEGMFRF